jgi:hypothetical protein
MKELILFTPPLLASRLMAGLVIPYREDLWVFLLEEGLLPPDFPMPLPALPAFPAIITKYQGPSL